MPSQTSPVDDHHGVCYPGSACRASSTLVRVHLPGQIVSSGRWQIPTCRGKSDMSTRRDIGFPRSPWPMRCSASSGLAKWLCRSTYGQLRCGWMRASQQGSYFGTHDIFHSLGGVELWAIGKRGGNHIGRLGPSSGSSCRQRSS